MTTPFLTTNRLPAPPGCTFDDAAAEHATRFFERYLRHSKGRWAGQRFALEPWQREEIVRPLFGWRRADGSRRFRRAWVELPRKNGKSSLCSGLALYLLVGDKEPGAEIYSAAADKEQARIVFQQAREMVEASPALLKRLKAFRNAITYPKRAGTYRVLSADAPTKHGLNAHGIIFDEIHAQPNRELYDVLDTSTGARSQPLMVMITTAGVFDSTSIYYENHEYAIDVASGVVDDPSWFVFIARAEEGDDWTSPATWRKANPGFGVTVGEEYLREQCTKAQRMPSYQNTFKRLHLNLVTSNVTAWLGMADWDRCAAPVPDLLGRPCYLGLDLASKTDIAALVAAFPPEAPDEPIWLLPFLFVPEDDLEERGLRNRAPYAAWVRDGHLIATEGNVIDYAAIEAEVAQLAQRYSVRQVAFDPWNATQMAQNLLRDGFECVEMRQGFASISAPTKEFERLVLSHRLGHGGHPVLRWMAGHVMVVEDAAGNKKPDKAKSRQKIDGIVASIMAVGRAILHDPQQSAYDDPLYAEKLVQLLQQQ